MKTNRRKFIGTALAASLGSALPRTSYSSTAKISGANGLNLRYEKLDQILSQPVFRKEYFHDPVIIETLELLRFKDSFLCRVRSKEGAEGISVGHSGQLRSSVLEQENV